MSSLTDTTLSSAVTANSGALVLGTTTGLVPGDVIAVESELCRVLRLERTSPIAYVTRGQDGTTAVAHAQGAAVSFGASEAIASVSPTVTFPSAATGESWSSQGAGTPPIWQAPAEATVHADSPLSGDGSAGNPLTVQGATAGPFTTILSITVVNGVVTDLQGS